MRDTRTIKTIAVQARRATEKLAREANRAADATMGQSRKAAQQMFEKIKAVRKGTAKGVR